MKKLLPIVFFIIAASGLSAQTATDPKISFTAETVDFGTVTQGTEQIRTFTITNTGTAPLHITQIRGACGCTTFPGATYPVDVAPGASMSFNVKYDTQTRIGMFDKQVMVYCNASNCTNGVYTVKIKGNVVPGGTATATTSGQ
ncbi:MAG TPA: DUF1573 domain-containing protein [Bacteroidia bacterium]|jgi:hypothetical protein|nr:DUF1573 domain-containing protein [Bacteroidia bacterium]